MNKIFLITCVMLIFAAVSFAQEEDFWDEMLDETEEFVVVKVVTASKIAETFEEAPGIVSAITRDEFQKMGAKTISDILNIVPGFTVGRTQQSGSHLTVYVRGKASSAAEGVLFLMNGKRLNDGMTGGGVTTIPDYPLDNVKQIEIIRGPGSALYGANAFVGVVNIITLNGEELDGMNVYYRGGTLDGNYATFEHGQALDNGFNYALYGSFTKFDNDDLEQRDVQTDVFDTTGYGTEFGDILNLNNSYTDRENSEANKIYNFGANLDYKDFNLTLSYNEGENTNNWGVVTDEDPTDEKYRNKTETSRFFVGSDYQKKLSEKITLDFSGSYLAHESESTTKDLNTGMNINPPGITSSENTEYKLEVNSEDWDFKARTINFETSAMWEITENHVLIAGLNYQRDEVDKSEQSHNLLVTSSTGQDSIWSLVHHSIPEAKTRDLVAGFAQNTWKPFNWLNLTGGLRADKYSDFDLSINPRLAIVTKLSKKATVKALYGRAFRAPTMSEMYLSSTGFGMEEEGEEKNDLDPELIDTYEIQFNYKPVETLALSATGFYYKITDVIRTIRIDHEETTENSGDFEGKGIELEARYSPKPNLWLFTNYSYAETEKSYEEQGRFSSADIVPYNSLNYGVNVSLFDKLNLNLNGYSRWKWDADLASERLMSYEELERRLTPELLALVPEDGLTVTEYLETTFPNYTILNSHIELTNILPRTTFTFDVNNILDDVAYFSDQRSSSPKGIPSGGRQILGGIRFEF